MGPNKIAESYQSHALHEFMQAEEGRLPASLSAPDSVDAWRHRRMHRMFLPLIVVSQNARWLTVGDGNYGSDALFLQQQGVDVLASSLTDTSLRVAAKKGYLKKYAAVNAEQIPYEDESFDFVLCKEAYHHFPRPAVAFYEMLRVAKEAVVLIEPYDGPKRFLDMIKEPAKKLLWGKDQTIHFEPSGNYIYRINPKQMGKKLAAMGYATIAYRTFNDIFIPCFGDSKSGASFGGRMTRAAILLLDLLCALRMLNPALITIICFKEKPSKNIEKSFNGKFRFRDLPINPYLER